MVCQCVSDMVIDDEQRQYGRFVYDISTVSIQPLEKQLATQALSWSATTV